MADRMVLMASACPPIACGAILSDAKVLREAAKLIRGSAPPEPARPFTNAVAAELARARARFPGNSHQLAALVEGVGEVARALIDREETVDVLMGCVQVAAMAQRVAEDGDDDFPGYEPAPSDRVAEGRRAPYDKAYGEALGVEPAPTGVREDERGERRESSGGDAARADLIERLEGQARYVDRGGATPALAADLREAASTLQAYEKALREIARCAPGWEPMIRATLKGEDDA